MTDQQPKWEFHRNMFGGGNYSMNFGDFYISYNPDAGEGIGMFSADDGGDETALCKGGKYFILNGDFRKNYEELGPKGFDACFEFYTKQNNVSSWSDKAASA